MIHQLLLTLRDYTGGLFVPSGGLQVSPEALPPFLHPSEAGLLGRVCHLGTAYLHFSDFIRHFAAAEPVVPAPAAPGPPAAPPPLPAVPPQDPPAQPRIYLRD